MEEWGSWVPGTTGPQKEDKWFGLIICLSLLCRNRNEVKWMSLKWTIFEILGIPLVAKVLAAGRYINNLGLGHVMFSVQFLNVNDHFINPVDCNPSKGTAGGSWCKESGSGLLKGDNGTAEWQWRGEHDGDGLGNNVAEINCLLWRTMKQFPVPWDYILNYLQHLEHIMCWYISTYFTFILVGQWKRKFTQL